MKAYDFGFGIFGLRFRVLRRVQGSGFRVGNGLGFRGNVDMSFWWPRCPCHCRGLP